MLKFTSDLHYNHDNIVDYCNRPWSKKEQNDILLQKWNRNVDVNDTAYILGDLFFYMTQEEMVQVLTKMNGKKHLIIGNHDSRKTLESFLNEPKTKVKEVDHIIELKVNKQLFVMAHYPMESWNKMGGGSFMLHGHCHSNIPSRGLRLDVGIDNHPTHDIFSIDEVYAYMENLKTLNN